MNKLFFTIIVISSLGLVLLIKRETEVPNRAEVIRRMKSLGI